MQAVKRWFARRHALPVWAAVLFIALAAALVTYALFAISPLETHVLYSLTRWSGGLTPLLNFLPVFLFMLLLYFITSKLIASIAVVSFVVLLMAIVNHAKLVLRGDPLLHWDFTLLSEVAGVAGGFGLLPVVLAIGAAAAFILMSILLAKLIRTVPMRAKERAIGTVACVLVIFLCNATLYSSKALEASLPMWGNMYNQADVHNSKGNLYSFIHNWNISKRRVPDGYNAMDTREFVYGYTDTHPTKTPATRPNIIMVMGEAYSAISESPVIDFEGYRDPMQHFKALAADGISGEIIVPARGGGTSDTEFDVLTATPTRFLRNAPYSYRSIVGPVEAMPSLLGGIGYESFALHPGYPWFYNRQNVYPHLGFDQTIFEDAFPRDAYLDTFISEEATYDMLLDLITTHLGEKSGTPLFGFCLTIQNHAAYLDRYLPTGTVNFNTTAAMTEREQNVLSNYFAGAIDADDQLARLAAYLDEQPEPFVLILYGDHLPSLDENLYDLLIPGADRADGSFRKETRNFAVPFLIWQNKAAHEAGTLDTQSAREALPDNKTISSNYLGAYLLEQLGMDSLSPYWTYANEVRQSFPVVMEGLSYTPNGVESKKVPAKTQDILANFRYWVQLRQDGEM